MNVTFSCPRCEKPSRIEVESTARGMTCPHCHVELTFPGDAFAGGGLSRCLACPSEDLFLRKDFPQRLGVGIVVLGFALSSLCWFFYWLKTAFGILFVTALLDFLLYMVMPAALICYRCGAIYRGAPGMDRYEGFDLEVHERYRQEAARMSQYVNKSQPVATTTEGCLSTVPTLGEKTPSPPGDLPSTD